MVIFIQNIFANKIIIRESSSCVNLTVNESTDLEIDDLSDTSSVEISVSNKNFNTVDKINKIYAIISTSNICSKINFKEINK